MENFTSYDMLVELNKTKLNWTVRRCSDYTFYDTSMNGYNINLTKHSYKNGFTVELRLSYVNGDRDTIEVLKLGTIVAVENKDCYETLSDNYVIINSDGRDALIKLLAKLEQEYNESVNAVNLITIMLKKLNS